MTVTPSGTISCGLLGGRALPDAERAGGLAADGRRRGNRAVHEELLRPQDLAQVVEVLRLRSERDREEDDRPALGGLLVHEALPRRHPSDKKAGRVLRLF